MAQKLSHTLSVVLMLCLTAFFTSTTSATPKNIIFMIGDGMGFEHVKAGGMYAYGQAGTLSFESFPYSGECTTYSANNSVTDSAAAGTALATGVKVNNYVVSTAIPGDGSELETLTEYFKARGKRTGIVTNAYTTDATPATFGAHAADRDFYTEIAEDYRFRTRPNVLFGGGGNGMNVSNFEAAGYTVVTTRAQMQAIDTDAVIMLNGQFGDSSNHYEPGLGALPHLSEMAVTALDILDNGPNGFFVMIEGALIDKACHSNMLKEAVLETVEFSNAVQEVINWAQGRDDTLIIVTADHECGGLKVTKNNGAGVLPEVTWGGTNHTGVNVPLFAWGENAQLVSGVMDNTEMFWVCTATPGTGAWGPYPEDGSIVLDTKATLSWIPQKEAVSHNIYFGTSCEEVRDANENTFIINQTETTCLAGAANGIYTDALVPGTTYYWRVDEVNDVDPNNPYVGEVWSFYIPPVIAWNPSPANGEKCVYQDVTLSWSAALGIGPGTPHTIYFGDNYDEVLAGTGDTLKGSIGSTTFTPGVLEQGKVYYWRVDETIGGGRGKYVNKGEVWSFTVNKQIVIDNFEMYNDMMPGRIFDAWLDGTYDYTNGSRVAHIWPNFAEGEHYAETTNVHSGNQSMPYYYSNNMIRSEAAKMLFYPRNWTENDVEILSIWFRGNKLNIVDKMYVSVSNMFGPPVRVYYDKPEDIQSETWTQWEINLQEFEDMGIDLTNIERVSIGFGDEDDLKIGGLGIVYFDDIVLYKPLE
ncbi:MAG: alkaline phosphatase [Sedimentisphaerales bacterium]|nr:alkaline phosphatase [Sedimentisphaerales bacterium]